MDGRRRQSNSGPASTAPIVTPYYSGSQPLTPVSDSGSGFSPRERFWTNSSNGRPPSPDPWTSSGYISQLLPPPCAEGMTPNYSPASHHSLNNNHSPPGGSTFALNIPSHSPYPPPSGGHNGNTASGNGGTAALMNLVNGNSVSSGSSDMSSSSPFSGPSPPNQAIPLSSPYGAPPTSNSPRRQYTPSTTPSPHVAPHQPNLNGMNGSSSHSHDNSPNSGNGAFHGYINGNLEPGGGPLSKGGGASDQGHPNDVPGYLPHPHSHQSQHSGRYPGEGKVSEGEMLHQYHHQQSYYHQNYAPYSQQQNQVYYDSYHGQGGGRRPFDPYQPYPTNHQSPLYDSSSYTTESSQNSQQQYNSKSNSRALSNSSAGPGNSRLKNSPENGPGKIEPCESLCEVGGQNKEGYEDDPNFEAVLQGHMGNYGSMDHHHRGGGGFSGAPYGQAPSYDHDRHSEEANFPRPPRTSTLEKNQSQESHQSQESSKSDDSTNSSKQVPPKKEKVKKKRSRGIRQLTESSGLHGKKGEGGDGSGSSPKTTSRTEPDLGCSERLLDERSNSSSSANFPFADGVGGANTSPGTTGTGGSAGPVSNAVTSEATKKKKKSWKKTSTTKPINSEQLLEERERHCAQYVESTERVLNKDGKSVGSKVKEEGFYQHHTYEERNITIDHQKESEVVPKKEIVDEKSTNSQQSENSSHATTDEDDGKKEVSKKDVPMVECGCFPVDEVHPEPGPFYTHLGAAHTLPELREVLEIRTGFRGVQLRFEKVIYTGKEGKTSQGCPLAKWIIRRGSYEEQLLFLVKHRKGHKCATAWIVVCCVIWEAVPPHFADNLYDTLVYKLNRFGIPTTRRSDTNEQRSCACQGVDPDTCGAAYSFGCAWSMFFNGCKYARSRNVRKFRLTEEHEEAELEEKVSHLATHLGPLYERVAPDSYKNQIEHENEGLECRLGYRPGRPFSGVTACVDYCSHAHKDAHNMINGCTVTVAFTRNRSIAKGDDEQYHVLPLYKLDDTDELGSKEGQKQKIKKGQLEILKKFPSKIRVRKVPLLPSRRRGKVKPPSGSSSSSHHHHHHQPKGNDLYSAEHGSLAMPPPMKREKLSIFEELNGPSGGSDLFDTRFHHPAPPAPFNPDGLWNHPSAYAPSSSGHGQQTGAPFRTYFDPTSMIPPPTSLATPTSQYAPSAVQFGHSLDFNLSSSRSTGPSSSSSAMQNPGITTSPSQGSGSGGANNSNNGGGSGSGGSAPSNMTTPGYTSLSPSILPSFRHTFMTEAESLSMLSAMASPAPTGGPGGSSPMVENSSSSRSNGKGSTTPGSSSSTPAQNSSSPGAAASASSSSFNHQEALGFPNSSSGYFGSSSSSSGNTPPYSASSSSSLYHPQAQHASPASCLSSPPSQGGGAGVSFNSSSYSPGSSFAPPGSMDPHHPGPFPGIPPINPWNPNVNTPPGYPHSAYGGSQTSNPYHHSHQHQMTSALNMNSMSPSHFQHMNQYSPYGNQPNFMSPSSMAAAAVAGMHSHHHPANPWANPLPTFGSHLTSHHAPPPPSCFVAPPKPKVIPEVNETYSDNEEAFKDPQLGGVAIALTHGSVILQCAKHEMHATTSLKAPNRLYPSRICLVFYQHKSMNNRFHGWSEWEKKIEAKKLQEVKLINQGKLEASPRKMKQLIKEGYIADNP